MRFVSVSVADAPAEELVSHALRELRARLAGEAPTVVWVFVTPDVPLRRPPDPAGQRPDVFDLLGAAFREAHVVGCTVSGVIAGRVETERPGAISLLAAVMPGVSGKPVRMEPRVVAAPTGIAEADVRRALPDDEPVAMMMLTDPHTCDSEALARHLDTIWPHAVKFGGLASGATGASRNLFMLNGERFTDGMVGIALYGDLVVETIVAQGCRPMGEPMRVTGLHEHLLATLDERPALTVLEEMAPRIDKALVGRFMRAPMIGVAQDPRRQSFRQGDFLIRHLMGVDPPRRALAVGHRLEVGDVVQFHVRDADASSDDLHEHLGRYGRPTDAAGALMITCIGRGHKLYGVASHDARAVSDAMPGVEVAGFFANGEIGQVHARTFLHGYTTVLAVFRPGQWN